MTRTTSTLIRATMNTLLAVALLALPASAETILCWPADTYDLDNDGFADYFAHKDDRVELDETDYTDAEALTCPAGYVMARGDVDDSDPAVHPRRFELPSNGVDDNCDGRVDEPTFFYQTSGYSNTTTAFSMRIKINDAMALSYASSPYWELVAYVQYQKLFDTSVTHNFGYATVTSFSVLTDYGRGYVRVTGLEPGTMYRARVQLFARYRSNPAYITPAGVQSTWYYTMTDSAYRITQARKRIVLRALYEAYLSEIGYTGYLGDVPDGTRYGADLGNWWCSEYYSWVTDHELEGMGFRINTGAMRDYFEDHSAWSELPEEQTYLIGFASPGDYLGIGDDIDNLTHSAMFLEYEPARDIVWSVEGNVSGLSDIGDSYASRRGGNEARVVERGSDTIAGWGLITGGMIRD